MGCVEGVGVVERDEVGDGETVGFVLGDGCVEGEGEIDGLPEGEGKEFVGLGETSSEGDGEEEIVNVINLLLCPFLDCASIEEGNNKITTSNAMSARYNVDIFNFTCVY